MFGFLRPGPLTRSGAGRGLYASHHCAGCQALAEFGGRPAALATSFDQTFLLLVLAALEGGGTPERRPCTALPFRTVPVERLSPAARRFVAALELALVEAKLKDDEADERGRARRMARGIAHRLLAGRAAKAHAALAGLGFPMPALMGLSEWQRAAESDPHPTLEGLAAPTAALLGEVFAFLAPLTGRIEHQPVLRALGEALGRALYLRDAIADRAEDRRRGRFNALGVVPAAEATEAGNYLARDLATVHDALASLPLGERGRLCERILADLDERVARELGLPIPLRTSTSCGSHGETCGIPAPPRLADQHGMIDCCCDPTCCCGATDCFSGACCADLGSGCCSSDCCLICNPFDACWICNPNTWRKARSPVSPRDRSVLGREGAAAGDSEWTTALNAMGIRTAYGFGGRPHPNELLAALRRAPYEAWQDLVRRVDAARATPLPVESQLALLGEGSWPDRFVAFHSLAASPDVPTDRLLALASDPGSRSREWAAILLEPLVRSVEERVGTAPRLFLCQDCFVRCAEHRVRRSRFASFPYFACRQCKKSHALAPHSGPVVALLDDGAAPRSTLREGTLVVSWTQLRRPFDFDGVRVARAGDGDAEQLAIQVGNDTDPLRRAHYGEMRCRVEPSSGLSPRGIELLRRAFGEVVFESGAGHATGGRT